jgi:hypothetical protein
MTKTAKKKPEIEYEIEDEAWQAEILALAEQNDGNVTPDMVWQFAKSHKRSALYKHPSFKGWDANKSAIEYWRQAARQLISRVRREVTYEESPLRHIAFVRDPDVEAGEQGYITVEKARSNKEQSKAILAMELNRVTSALGRAKVVAESLKISDEFDSMSRPFVRKIDRFKAEHRLELQ